MSKSKKAPKYVDFDKNSQVGLKFDHGKPQYSLMSIQAIEKLINVLMFGAKKYGRGNWKKGLDYTRIVDAMYRHLGEIAQGNFVDKETGELHSAHIMANAMFLTHFIITNTGKDDIE